MPVDLEALFPKLLNLVLDLIVVVDEVGNIAFISEACEGMLGYTPDELVGTQLMDLVYPEDLERTLDAAKAVMSGSSHIDFENRYLHKEGRIVHVLWSARWSAENGVRIAVARDVTKLRQADQMRDALYRISQAAHVTESLRSLCQEIHQVVGELLSTDDLYVTFYDFANNALSYPYAPKDRVFAWMEGPLQAGTAIAEVIGSGRSLLATRDVLRPGQGGAVVQRPEEANWLGVPLVSGGRCLGAVVIESQSAAEHYTEEDRDLLDFVATQISTVIERKKAEEDLRFIAHHDALTGLTNRPLFYDRLETALRMARRDEGQVALLYLDLNGFKRINDTCGHEAGDRILCEVSRRLEQCTRASDTVARMGGDEFTILLTGISDPESVATTVQKIRDVMAAPIEFNGHSFSAMFSIGTALYPDDGTDAECLLRSADAAMYGMKRGLKGAG
ncbi:diguanylate cyclase domain-containing protein [Marinobacter sp. 1Y8]